MQIKIAPKVVQNEHKDDSIMKESEEPDKEGSDHKPYATPEELESKRLAPEEILSLPKFKVPLLETLSDFDGPRCTIYNLLSHISVLTGSNP